MRLFRSKKRKLILKWLQRADDRDEAAEVFRSKDLNYRADVAQIIADTFRICADELDRNG